MDSPVWVSCGECDFGTEELAQMVDHILEAHPNYDRIEAQHYAEVWQESAYEAEELRNIERAEYFRKHGVDPEAEWDDHMPGK